MVGAQVLEAGRVQVRVLVLAVVIPSSRLVIRTQKKTCEIQGVNLIGWTLDSHLALVASYEQHLL